MLSFIKAINKALTDTVDTVSDVITAAQETVSMGTTYIHHRAVAQQLVDKDAVGVSTTLALEEIQAELEGNEKRQALYDEVMKHFN